MVYDLFSTKESLFVFDNVETFDVISKYMPQLSPTAVKPTIFITTQSANWGRNFITHNLDVISEKSAVDLIRSQLSHLGIDCSLADALAKKLQNLPLALQQSISYIRNHRTTIAAYISLFDTHFPKIFQNELGDTTYCETVNTVWKIAMHELLASKESMAVEIVKIASLLDGYEIHKELLSLLPNVTDVDINDAMEKITSYSLMNVNYSSENEVFYTMHALVQKVITLSMIDLSVWKENVLNLLEKAAEKKENQVEIERHCLYGDIWIKHVLCIAHRPLEDTGFLLNRSKLLIKTLLALSNNSMHERAITFVDIVLQNVKPRDQIDLVGMEEKIRILAPYMFFFCARTENFEKGCDLFLSLNSDVSALITNRNEYLDASNIHYRPLDERILDFLRRKNDSEEISEEDGEILAYYKWYFFLLLLYSGNSTQFNEFINAYNILRLEKVSELEIAHMKRLLAYYHYKEGKNEEAHNFCSEALNIYSSKLRGEDWYTLEAKKWMVYINKCKGDPTKDLTSLKDINKALSETLGRDHHDTLETEYQIGRNLIEQNKFDESQNVFQKLYDQRKALLGENHKDTLHRFDWLCLAMYKQNKFDESQNVFQKMYDQRKALLGENHEDTLDAFYWLGATMYEQNKFDESQNVFQKLYDQRKALLGENHKDTLHRFDWLCLAMYKQNKFDESQNVFQKLYDQRKALLGENHKDTLDAFYWLSLAKYKQNKFDE